MRYFEKSELTFQNNKWRDRFYQQMSDEQHAMFHAITENIFTFCEAKAGTGKTVVAVAAMIDLLANGEINKIIYIQKVSQRFLQNGFLPGTMKEKTAQLFQPVYDAMLTLGYPIYDVERMCDEDILFLATDSNLRGVNFEKAGVIVDEGENCDKETLKLIFTRVHDDCHVVLLGDSLQKDNRGEHNTDFVRYGRYLSDNIGTSVALTKNFRGAFSRIAEEFQ